MSSQQEDPNKAAKLRSKTEHENHFLFEKYKELQQKVDTFQMQKETIPQGWINSGWMKPTATATPQLQAPQRQMQQQGPQPVMMNHNLVQCNQPQGRLQPVFQAEQNLCQYPL